MASQASNSFADSIAARLLALCIALALAIVLVYNYRAEFAALFSAESEQQLPTYGSDAPAQEEINPALAECLKQRIGDVEKMKEDGILSDSQYADFRARAEQLCIQLNS